jgi:hypothetical protein
MRRPGKLAVLALLSVIAACGGSSAGGAANDDEAAAAETEEKSGGTDQRPASTGSAAEGGKGSGWRWKGKRQDCFYVHDNECFAEKKSACRAAGCGLSRCAEKPDTAPIKVSCKAE